MAPLTSTVVVVGAAGEVGSALLAGLSERSDLRLIAADVATSSIHRTCDRSQGDVWVPGDITDPPPELQFAITLADAVVLAVPERVAEAAMSVVCDRLAPGALLVDTLSVKSGWFRMADTVDPAIELLSINPMFAPSLGFGGRPIATIELRPGPRSDWFLALLEGLGSSIVPVEPDEHDRVTAAIQVATHAAILSFGLAVESLGHETERLSALFTPPHRTLMALLARICSGDAHVYHDIQRHNPHASAARRSLAIGLAELDACSADDSPASFAAMTARVQTVFGDQLDDFAEVCAQMFADAPSADEVSAKRERRPCAYRRW